MSIDISAKTIKPIRQTYDNVARRIGENKPASRYQEATFDVQATTNFHFRPTWASEYELYDTRRTKIVMQDWYAFKDPRQYYYGTYTMARAKQQDSMEKNFEFVEKRQLLSMVNEDIQSKVKQYFVPLRHLEWGANMNNCFVTDFGYGTAVTQITMFNAMDRLGIAQYITRVGLLLTENEPAILDEAKMAWLENQEWQPLRHVVEDSFVIEDWFETLLVQNVLIDSFIYPLFYEHWMNEVSRDGGSALVMLTEFMSDWYAETLRWTDAILKTAATESDENAALLGEWSNKWLDRVSEAVVPIATSLLGDAAGNDTVENAKQAILQRLSRAGVSA